MSLAVISVCALALAVLVSCVSKLNVGVLALALAWIVGVYIGGLPVNTVMSGFPSQLFLTLTGVTLLFALAQSNGTLERLTHHAVGVCRGNRGMIPVMFFLLAAALASMGPGNISTAALLCPLAMATASRAGIPLFLMSIMVGNGANAGGLSPFAPTGIIVNGLMARNGLAGLEW
jgi:Na+/H+ antiporter NhaD/arsenite permease-like protein